MERLDGRVKITAKFPMAGGGYADIYPGIWHGDLASLGPGVWTGDTMSDGNVAVVIKVFRNANNKANTPETQQKYAKRLENEYRVWALLRHPNVLPSFGLIDDPAIPSTGIVAPRCTLGDLRAFFSDPTRASSVNRFAIVKGIAEGLTYLHEKKVVHGDLTMHNVLMAWINGELTPLITDFGLSRILEIDGYTSTLGGAVHRHLPPEILTAGTGNRTTKMVIQPADVWCFGMLMLEILTGNIPFWYMFELEALMAVAYRNEMPNQNRYPAFPHDKGCWDIMRRCWHVDPSQREEMPGLLKSLDALG